MLVSPSADLPVVCVSVFLVFHIFSLSCLRIIAKETTAAKTVTGKFIAEHDISLLKEVMAVGSEIPFLQPYTSEMWKEIATNMAKEHPKMEDLAGGKGKGGEGCERDKDKRNLEGASRAQRSSTEERKPPSLMQLPCMRRLVRRE